MRIIPITACQGGLEMFKNMRLLLLFDVLLNPSFKMTTNLAKKAKNTANTCDFMY